ncbi:protein of unknown function (plasmid) [Cupriavidus taiwanensis]|nr:protein of unknown function [Cupriavidus taiwanensis]
MTVRCCRKKRALPGPDKVLAGRQWRWLFQCSSHSSPLLHKLVLRHQLGLSQFFTLSIRNGAFMGRNATVCRKRCVISLRLGDNLDQLPKLTAGIAEDHGVYSTERLK